MPKATSPDSRPCTNHSGKKLSNAHWLPLRRHQAIPSNAVGAGFTPTDGEVWVGRHQEEAGKINADDSKMWNVWVHHSGSCEAGEILMCHPNRHHWESIARGGTIPTNAVQAGTSETDGVNYVARINGEAGKLNCDENDHTIAWNLWSHAAGCSQSGEILVIDERPASPAPASEETHTVQESDEPPASPTPTSEEIHVVDDKLIYDASPAPGPEEICGWESIPPISPNSPFTHAAFRWAFDEKEAQSADDATIHRTSVASMPLSDDASNDGNLSPSQFQSHVLETAAFRWAFDEKEAQSADDATIHRTSVASMPLSDDASNVGNLSPSQFQSHVLETPNLIVVSEPKQTHRPCPQTSLLAATAPSTPMEAEPATTKTLEEEAEAQKILSSWTRNEQDEEELRQRKRAIEADEKMRRQHEAESTSAVEKSFEVGEHVKVLGMSFEALPPIRPIVTSVLSDSWADQVSMGLGDQLLRIDGIDVENMQREEFIAAMQRRPLLLTFKNAADLSTNAFVEADVDSQQ